MATYLSKKSYQRKNFKEVEFQDLWGDNGVFTTMWIFGNPPKILFFKQHIKNLIKSLKAYKLDKPNLEKNILKLLKLNIKKNIKYNHLLRIALNNKIISISFRKRIKPKLKFNLKLIKYKRSKPEFNRPLYKALNIEESSVLIDQEHNPLRYERGNGWADIAIFHPKTTYIDNRPNWLFTNGNEKVIIDLKAVEIEFPVMVLAYKKGEDIKISVPVDIAEAETKTSVCALGLKKGNYEIVVTNGKKSVKFLEEVK